MTDGIFQAAQRPFTGVKLKWRDTQKGPYVNCGPSDGAATTKVVQEATDTTSLKN